jgi:ribosomal protein S18 acetylase RimI-like enzyme
MNSYNVFMTMSDLSGLWRESGSQSIVESVYNATNLPPDKVVAEMVAFDALCFAGKGSTTSIEYTPPLMTAIGINNDITRRNNTFRIQRTPDGKLVSVMQTFVKANDGEERELHLMSMAIDPHYRGRGIARGLLTKIAAEAKINSIDKLTLRVDPLNTAALKLYLSEGFIIVGARTKNLGARNSTVVTLSGTKRLSSQPGYENPSQELRLVVDAFTVIDAVTARGFVGTDLVEGELVMKKLDEASKILYPHWN